MRCEVSFLVKKGPDTLFTELVINTPRLNVMIVWLVWRRQYGGLIFWVLVWEGG